MAPMYLQDLLNAKTPGRYSLSSDALGLLVLLVTRFKTYGDCAFALTVPRVWKSLPFSIRNNASIKSFKTNLKLYFLNESFNYQSQMEHLPN